MKKDTSILIQNVNVNASVIAAYGKRLSSIQSVLSVWANAAAYQATQGNLNWATSLFASPALRMKSGDLSKQGKEVLAYIQAHYPLLVWDKDNKVIGRKKQSADSIFNGAFLAPTATDDTPDVINHNGKLYLPKPTFFLTLEEWLNRPAAEADADEVVKSIAVKVFTKQATKAFEASESQRLVGTVDEFSAAIAEAEKLVARLQAQRAAIITAESAKEQRVVDIVAAGPVAEVSTDHMPLDTAKADELLKSGQAGKATRAPKKAA